MPSLVEALMAAGAQYLAKTAEAEDLREQRRQEALLRALQMRDLQERLRLAQEQQRFSELSTMAQLSLQQRELADLARYRQQALGLERERFGEEQRRYSAQQQAQRQLADVIMRGRLPEYRPLAGTQGGAVSAGIGLPAQPVGPAAPVVEQPAAPRVTRPRTLPGATVSAPTAPAPAQRTTALPVPIVTEEILAEAPVPIQQPAAPAPETVPELQPYAQVPETERLAWLLEVEPEAQFHITEQGVIIPTVPTPSQQRALEHEEFMRRHAEIMAPFEEESARLGLDVERIKAAAVVRFGMSEAELQHQMLQDEAAVAHLRRQEEEETAPERRRLLETQRRQAEMELDLTRAALEEKRLGIERGRWELEEAQRRGHYPGTETIHRSYTYADPATVALGWAEVEARNRELALQEREFEAAVQQRTQEAVSRGTASEDEAKAAAQAEKLLFEFVRKLDPDKSQLWQIIPEVRTLLSRAGPAADQVAPTIEAVLGTLRSRLTPAQYGLVVGDVDISDFFPRGKAAPFAYRPSAPQGGRAGQQRQARPGGPP